MLRCSQKDARFCQCESKAEKKGDMYLKSRMASEGCPNCGLAQEVTHQGGDVDGPKQDSQGSEVVFSVVTQRWSGSQKFDDGLDFVLDTGGGGAADDDELEAWKSYPAPW